MKSTTAPPRALSSIGRGPLLLGTLVAGFTFLHSQETAFLQIQKADQADGPWDTVLPRFATTEGAFLNEITGPAAFYRLRISLASAGEPELLPILPRPMNLGQETNRAFAISAEQITTAAGLCLAYSGTRIILGLVPGGIAQPMISPSGIGTMQLADGAVNRDKIAKQAVTPDRLTEQYVRITGDIMTGTLSNLVAINSPKFVNPLNKASGVDAFVLGGLGNEAVGDYSTVGGGILNLALGVGSVVAGGGCDRQTLAMNRALGAASTVSGGLANKAEGDWSTVAGGILNYAEAEYAALGGGRMNKATGSAATIGGGITNRATAYCSTVPGGNGNEATGACSFAAGRRARALHDGCFVWGDDTDASVASEGPNQFIVRASGGIWLGSTSDPSLKPDIFIGTSTRAFLSQGGIWTDSSDKNNKVAFRPVIPREILERLDQLPITSWSHQREAASVRHIGPMAQDFRALFQVGLDDQHIAPLDANGVALAAIQALHQIIRDQERALAEQARDLQELRQRLTVLEGRLPDPNDFSHLHRSN